jgi:hypothetical protein
MDDAGFVSQGQATPEEWAAFVKDQGARANLAPQMALGMLGGGAGFAEPSALGIAGGGIKAYHGSPYDFDKFDMSKIGTGEGAQAYGHGLYFAESPEVAKSYKDALSSAGVKLPQGFNYDPTELGILNRAAQNQKGDLQGMIAHLRDTATIHDQYGNSALAEATRNGVKHLEDGTAVPYPPGRMYEVSINADPSHFLDWDKPLSEQPPAAKTLANELWHGDPSPLLTGKDIYYSQGFKNPADTSGALNQAGIPGIRYLDQGSRSNWIIREHAGQFQPEDTRTGNTGPYYQSKADAQAFVDKNMAGSTRNYVVFDDKLIDIIKKYGIAGLMATGAASQLPIPQQRAPIF